MIVVCAGLCVSCSKKEVDGPFKLAGTYWANESSLPGYKTDNRLYFYDVWHFVSEKEAELTQYNTGYTKVDIGHGDDPMKYGSVYKDGCGTIHVRSFNYPKISTYETSPDLKGNMEDKNYWDGEFVSEEFLIMDGSARYLRIYRNK